MKLVQIKFVILYYFNKKKFITNNFLKVSKKKGNHDSFHISNAFIYIYIYKYAFIQSTE